MWLALQKMITFGKNWASFIKWLQNNICACILWFTTLHKDVHWKSYLHNIFLDSNGNESFNKLIKSCNDFIFKKGKWLEMVSLVHFLEEADCSDASNILRVTGLQYMGTAKWKHLIQKGSANILTLLSLMILKILQINQNVPSQKRLKFTSKQSF